MAGCDGIFCRWRVLADLENWGRHDSSESCKTNIFLNPACCTSLSGFASMSRGLWRAGFNWTGDHWGPIRCFISFLLYSDIIYSSWGIGPRQRVAKWSFFDEFLARSTVLPVTNYGTQNSNKCSMTQGNNSNKWKVINLTLLPCTDQYLLDFLNAQ